MNKLPYRNNDADASAGKPDQVAEKEVAKSNHPATFGQKAVGINFNPSMDSRVDRIKQLSANLIDEIHGLRLESESGEVKRMASVAITDIQSGQMWGVKAATWKD